MVAVDQYQWFKYRYWMRRTLTVKLEDHPHAGMLGQTIEEEEPT